MKKIIGFFLILTTMSFTCFGQKVAVGKYSTKESSDKSYYAALEAVSGIKFTIKSTDKTQGIIQAEQLSGGGTGKVFASIFVLIKQEDGKTVVQATFTRNDGFMGGDKPAKMAQQYGDYMKKTIADLDIAVEDRK
jgi:hypothetical protein